MADGKVTITVDLDGTSAQEGVKQLKGLLGELGDSSSKGFNRGTKSAAAFGAIMGVTSRLVGAGMNAVSSSIGGAVSRVDTMNRFPETMKLFGYSAKESRGAIDRLSKGIEGLPTPLDAAVKSAQQLTITTGSLDKGTKLALAFNNAMIGYGANTTEAEQALRQFNQSLGSGKIYAEEFNSVSEAAPGLMSKMAESFGFGKNGVADLKKALSEGKITAGEFADKMIELNDGQNGFAAMAQSSAGGIATSWQNVKTAITKGVANIIQEFDKAAKAKGLGGIAENINKLKTVVNGAFSAVTPYVSKFAGFLADLSIKAGKVWQSLANTGVLSAVGQAFNSLVNAVGHVYQSLSNTGAISLFTSVIGTLVKWVAQATTVIANFISSLPAGVFQGLTIGIIGLIGSFKALSLGFKTFDKIKSFDPFKAFRKGADDAVQKGTQTKSKLHQILTGLGKTFEGIGKGFGAAFKGFGEGLKALPVGKILAFGGAVATAAVGIGAGIAIITAGFTLLATQSSGVSEILGALGSLIQTVGATIGNLFNTALQGLAQALLTVAPVLPIVAQSFAMLSPLVTAAGSAISMIISAFSGLAPVITALGGAISQIVLSLGTAISQIATAVTPIVSIIGDVFTTCVSIVSNAIVQIVQALAPFMPAISEMVQAIAPVLGKIADAFNNLISQIRPIIDSLVKLFKTLGEQISNILKSVGDVIESIGGAIRNVLDGVAGIFESIGNSAKNAGQGVKLMAQGIKILVDLNLADLVGTLGAVAGGLGGIASSGIVQAGPGLKAAGQGLTLIATAGQQAATSMQNLPSAFSTMNESIGTLPQALKTASTSMSDFATSVLTSFAGLTGSATSLNSIKTGLTGLTTAMTTAQARVTALTSSFTSLGGSVSSLGTMLATVPIQLTAISTSGMQAVMSLRQLTTIAPTIATGFSSISIAAISSMSALNSAVRSAMSQAVSTMRSSMQQMVSVVRQSATQMTQAGRQAGQGVSDGITNGIRGGIGNATAAMSAMVNAIRSTAMSGIGAMRGIGNQIGQGLAQGMYAALGAVTAAANALVAQAERAAQAKAKIHSPSRLFRDNVGRYISQGVAVGIIKDADRVDDAMGEMYARIQAFNFRAEDIIGVGNTSFSKTVQVKSDLDRAVKTRVEVAKEKGNDLIKKALDVAQRAVERPLNMRLDDGTLVAKTGDKFARYQTEQTRRENRMRGVIL